MNIQSPKGPLRNNPIGCEVSAGQRAAYVLAHSRGLPQVSLGRSLRARSRAAAPETSSLQSGYFVTGPKGLFVSVMMAVSCGCSVGSEAAAAEGAPKKVSPAPVSPSSEAGYRSVIVRHIPFVEQQADFCGEACVEMGARAQGLSITQGDVFNAAQINPALGRGALAKELVRALRTLGFEPGRVWYHIDRGNPGPDLEAQFAQLHQDLQRQIPSIVCTYYDQRSGAPQHFRLVVGYDTKTKEILFHDPAEKKGAYRRMAKKKFFSLWSLKYKESHDVLVRMPLRKKQGAAPHHSSATRAQHTPAEYAQEVIKLQRTLTNLRGRFSWVIEPPFLVVGDGPRRDVVKHAQGLIRWSVGELKKHYFAKDPHQIITIWLFKDSTSFHRNTRVLVGEAPDTPFGFYSPAHQALIMNIRTGGGTLVHEIVHPFMEANVPTCPPWFNEGMGSLYEGVGRRNHQIWGYLNWRLPSLQWAIRAGTLPAFAELMQQDEQHFYGRDPGTNYAQSRYLLYYLQDKGLLREYYRKFVRSRAADPSGYATLKELLGVTDMAAWQRRWARYILAQKYVKPPVK